MIPAGSGTRQARIKILNFIHWPLVTVIRRSSEVFIKDFILAKSKREEQAYSELEILKFITVKGTMLNWCGRKTKKEPFTNPLTLSANIKGLQVFCLCLFI